MKQTDVNRYISGLAFVMIILVGSVSCTKDNADKVTTSGGSQPGANEIWIQGMAFNPASITVTAGATIKWTNKDAEAHTVTANDNSFDSGNIAVNGTFSHTFSSAGTISYYCKIHPSMKASVMVQ